MHGAYNVKCFMVRLCSFIYLCTSNYTSCFLLRYCLCFVLFISYTYWRFVNNIRISLLAFLTFSATKCRKCLTIYILLFVLYLGVCLDPAVTATFSHTESVDNLAKWPPPSSLLQQQTTYFRKCIVLHTSFSFTTSCYS